MKSHLSQTPSLENGDRLSHLYNSSGKCLRTLWLLILVDYTVIVKLSRNINVHLFTYCLLLLFSYNNKAEYLWQKLYGCQLTIWPLWKKICQHVLIDNKMSLKLASKLFVVMFRFTVGRIFLHLKKTKKQTNKQLNATLGNKIKEKNLKILK